MGRAGEKRGISGLDKNSLHIISFGSSERVLNPFKQSVGFQEKHASGCAAPIKYVYPVKTNKTRLKLVALILRISFMILRSIKK